MPNYVKNRLEIKGTQEEVNKVLEFIKGEPNENGECPLISFEKIIPMPKELHRVSSSSNEDALLMYIEYAPKVEEHFNDMELWDVMCKIQEDNKMLFYRLMNKEDGKLVSNIKKSLGWEKVEDTTVFPTLKAMYRQEIEKSITNKNIYRLGKELYNSYKKYGFMDWYGWSIANWGTKWNAFDIEQKDTNIIEFTTAWNGVPIVMDKLHSIFPDVTFEYLHASEDRGYCVGKYLYSPEKCYEERIEQGSVQAEKFCIDLWGWQDCYRFNEKENCYEFIDEDEEE